MNSNPKPMIRKDEDGITYYFDPARKAWFPEIPDDLVEKQQAAYKVQGVDESIPVEKPSVKRKREKALGIKPESKKPAISNPKKNTAVYITGLPLDCTESEISEVFKKGGVFLVDPATLLPKIKMYREDGEFKGNALVIYLRQESVQLACQLLDETPFRFQNPLQLIKVQPAVFKEKEPAANTEDIDKKSKAKVYQKMNKQLGWFEEDEKKKETKCVILKQMFTLDQLRDTPELMIDLKVDVRSECENLGDVTSVTLFDLEEDGVMMVKFKTQIEALACAKKMNGRFYDGRVIAAYVSVGNEKFKKTKRNDAEEERQRHEEYGKWLDSQ